MLAVLVSALLAAPGSRARNAGAGVQLTAARADEGATPAASHSGARSNPFPDRRGQGAGNVGPQFLLPMPVTTTLIVHPGDLQGWQPNTTVTTVAPAPPPSTAFVNGPGTPPLGSGSVELRVGSDGDNAAEMRQPDFASTTLPNPASAPAAANELTALGYSTYAQSGGSGGQTPYLILNIDNNNDGVFNVGSGDDQLFFEPGYQNGTYPVVDPSLTIPNQCGANPSCVTPGQWQTWDALNGGWWALSSATFGPPLTTLKFYRSQHPNARIVNSSSGLGGVRVVTGFGAGSWDDFIGNVDAFTIGVGGNDTIYDFELTPPQQLSINDVTMAEGDAPGTTTFTFAVTLTQPAPAGGVTFDISTADGTAQDDDPDAEDNDYVARSLTGQTIPENSTGPYNFSVTVNRDTTPEPNENFGVSVTNITGVAAGDTQGLGTIVNDDGANVSVRDARTSEPDAGSTNMVFTVVLSEPSAQTVSVNFTTADDTGGVNPATAGTDYTPTNGTVIFMPGDRVKTISVPVLSDGPAAETDETFLVNLSSATNATIFDGQAVGTIKQGTTPGAVLISELRTSGPGASGTGDLDDDYVEIYNNSDSPLTVQASDGSAGYSVVASNQGCTDDPVIVGTIPNGTIIPARGHYLVVGSGYSLTAYAAGNLTMTENLDSDANVGLFSTAELTNLSTVNRLDAVGFHLNTADTCDLLRERSTLNAASGSTSEHAFVRKYDEGVIVDTGVNADDFLVVSTTPATPVGNNVTPTLGAPGPQRKESPNEAASCGAVSFGRELLDPAASAGVAPNRVRRQCSDPLVEQCNAARSVNGTLSLRRTFTNNTGQSVTSLRFRIYDLTTFPQPSGTADLRALSSGPVNAPLTGGSIVTVQGTTLDNSAAQPLGGGVNSSLAAGTVTLANPLAHGASINLQFLFGVQQVGSYRLGVLIEALPGAGRQDLWILTGDTEAGGDSEQACPPTPTNISGTKTVGGSGFNPGNTITYTVVLTNNGSVAQDDNNGDEFTDVLPAGLTLVSATANTGTASANTGTNTVTWNGSLAGFASVTITIQATINSGTEGTTITNQGSINFDADNDNDNEASAQTDDPSVGGASDPTSFKVNTRPAADNQSVTTDEDTPKAITLTGSDADNDPLTFTVVDGPDHGQLTGTAPNLTYTPDADYHGPDSFTFKVNDGQVDSTSNGTVSITVSPVADTPDVADVATAEDTQSGAIVVAKNPADGAEVTHFRVSAITGGTLYMPDGTTQITGGTFVAFADAAAGLRFTPALNYTGPAGFTVQAATGSTPADLGGGTDTSTVTINAVNDRPTLGPLNNRFILEDSAGEVITLTGIGAGGNETQTLVVTATSSNAAVVPDPVITYTSPNSSGTLSYAPAANANGTAIITVTVSDGGGGTETVSRTFSINVTPVNDAPSFTKGADQTVGEDAGPQTLSNWATAISAGAANESGQVLSFTVTNNNNALFSQQPAISPAGTLTYTPAMNASGAATVTVTLKDGSGTANSGQDMSSPPQTFDITVNAANDAPVNNVPGAQSVVKNGT
ncbi:MAG TPA: tandem-95 repeat protein, partial [Pyrinomonadaceae bacterium]|nr:tandem-95 repeat protein [Pyrinomonadaceae bacterium]